MYLNQLIGQGGDIVSWLVWLIFFMVFFMFYPRIMLSQIMWKLEGSAKRLELLSTKSKKYLLSEISKKPTNVVKDSVNRFFEFFVIEPVSLDPYGIIKKVDHLVKNEKARFRYFTEQVAPHMNEERKANIQMGFAGGIQLHMIAKIVRHYVEMIKKTKSYQIAMIIQMQLPLIERIAKAMYEGTKSLARGEPIGDGIGPWIVANLSGDARQSEIEEGIILSKVDLEGRHAFLLRARGPGGRIGYPGKAVERVMKKHKIARIITIDAAAKLEGEETGSIAEGVGVAMGGPGVERSYIENAALTKDLPMDSIVVKMSAEEAIQPMRKKMIESLPLVKESIKRSLSMAKKGDSVIIVGVGNTSGIGTQKADADNVAKWVNNYEKKLKAKKKRKKD
ncbi:MAG: DUF1512 domain-containing protein [Candidatus Aenigmarchaeota archaeon]|nr:DUF1512 domain-containing protein [Candidatus Aenigmarchaeota archaeon]